MTLYVDVMAYRLSFDGLTVAVLKLEKDGREKTLMYRVGAFTDESRKNLRYIHEVADVLADRISSWRKIDSEKDLGLTPEIFRSSLKEKLGID